MNVSLYGSFLVALLVFYSSLRVMSGLPEKVNSVSFFGWCFEDGRSCFSYESSTKALKFQYPIECKMAKRHLTEP